MLRDQPCPVLPESARADLPRIWLFTDRRNDDDLERAVMRLPSGSGIVFRHYHLPEVLRRERFERVKKLARRHGHMLFLAGSPSLARLWGADGVHGRVLRRPGSGGLLHSAPVHDAREIQQANRVGADIYFLSPVFATRSHPGERPLNPLQVRRLAALCNGAVIYLGGMNQHRYRTRKNHLTHGWAAIDALS
tara:strand:- start:8409 stop:8984 length:576 start_codon:yes stop_codon:yes gene_type:complete